MGFNLRFLRVIPRPERFLYFFDLKTGAEVILNATLLNKAFGLYGILAIITGASVSPLQVTMFIFSLFIVAAYGFLYSKIHTRDPLSSLLFAYIYLIESSANAIFTLLFGINWFLGTAGASHMAAHKTGKTEIPAVANTQPAPEAIDRKTNLTIVTEALAGAASISPAEAIGGADGGPLILQAESPTSILIISLLWAIRLYTILVVFAFARRVVRESATPGEEPFTGFNNGQGWRGRLGRFLIGINKGYWAGKGWNVYESKPAGGRRRRGRKASTAGRNTDDGRQGLLSNVDV